MFRSACRSQLLKGVIGISAPNMKYVKFPKKYWGLVERHPELFEVRMGEDGVVIISVR